MPSALVALANPPALRYRKPRRQQPPPRPTLPSSGSSTSITTTTDNPSLTPLGQPRPSTTFGVPDAWTRFHDTLLWSFRGPSRAVHRQLQSLYHFQPALSRDWVRLRLRETAAQQLAFLRQHLPAETGTINRVQIRATVLDGGHDFFYDGPAHDATPALGNDGWLPPPVPERGPLEAGRQRQRQHHGARGVPEWKAKWDWVLVEGLKDGESAATMWNLLRRMKHPDLDGLTRGWLECLHLGALRSPTPSPSPLPSPSPSPSSPPGTESAVEWDGEREVIVLD
ncbi:MAG: hypothetical protein M1826_000740 [Phylliscum demangeonii]|nr:MAG: hypothetical protein M1826_000740 [Phylliscum demangeonii]